ncbi:hypothetical protein SteCoe_30830 [Stentor coeruleus]|uniref:Uncharacterized protein n=1 Tax=Stentor coeruleus TaxID=5963 RepID=A0A1R2B2Q5_9CILI|nr:hypothetical protein SteCoe_30830 [Stentor coeruleus]
MFFALLFLSVSGTLFEEFDSMLDPVDISWPHAWVPNLVDLSSNHAGDTSQTATVVCKIPIDLPADTYAEIDLGFASTYSTVLESSQSADSDKKFIFDIATLPSAGTYGPISLVVRQSANGQILASHESLGFVAILAAAPAGTTNSLTVAHNSGNSLVASATATLQFKFTLTGKLHYGDYFYLDFDSSFGVGTLSFTWDETDASTATPYLNTTALEVVKSDDGKSTVGVYIYGIQEEVNSGLVVCFYLSGFTNPAYAKAGGSYTWSVTAYRFGTSTTLQKYLGSSPSVAITAGSVTVTSWTPTNGVISVDKIAKDSVLYMTLIFSFTHDIQAGGTITIEFTDLAINDKAYNPPSTQALTGASQSYLSFINNEKLDYVVCDINSPTKIICDVQTGKTLSASSSLTVYMLAHFSSTSTSTVSKIVTATSSGNTIDSLATAKSITLQAAATSTLIGEPTTYFNTLKNDVSSSPKASAGDNGAYGLLLDFVLPVQVISGQQIKLNLPIQNVATACDFDVAFGTTFQGMYLSSVLTSLNVDWDGLPAYTTSTSMISVATGAITATLASTFAANDHLNLMITSGTTAATAGNIKMPNFESNIYSMQEITVSFTVGTTFYYFSKPFYVTANNAACTSEGIPGAVATLTWTSSIAYTAASGYSAYVDFAFDSSDTITGDYGSGLDSGSTYPSNGVTTGYTFTIKYTSTESDAGQTHFILTLTSIAASAVTINFPFVSLKDTKTYDVTATLYSVRSSDGALFKLSTKAADQVTGSVSIKVAPKTTSTTKGDAAASQDTSKTISNFQFTKTPTASTSGVGLAFEYGFFLGSSPTLKLEGTNQIANAASLTVLSTSDMSFKYTVAYLSVNLVAEETKFIISSVTTPWFVKDASNIHLYSYTTQGGVCLNHVAAPYATVLGDSSKFTSVSLTPLTATGLGSTSQTIDLSISLTLPGPVYDLSDISFTATIGTAYTGKVSGKKWTLSAGTVYTAQGTMSGDDFDTLTSGDYTDITDDDVTDTGEIKTLIPSGTVVKITVYSVPVPTVTVASTIYAGFLSVYVKSSTGNIYQFIDATHGDNSLTRTTYAVGASASKSGISSVYVFPNVQGSVAVQFEMSFTAAIAIPSGTQITIKGESFIDDAIADENTWCSYGFASSTVTSNNLVITTNKLIPASTKVTIRKDLAFTISSVTVSPSFIMVATYGGATIIEDLATDTGLKTLTYVTKPGTTVTSASVSIDYSNKGLDSWHTFNVVLSADSVATWVYCFEAPGSYDAHPGPSDEYDSNPGVHYYTVNSTVSSDINCYGEHWMILCSGIGVITKGSTIDISINFRNPGVTTANWNLYITDSADTLVVEPKYTIAATYTSIPDSKIDAYYVDHDPEPTGASDIVITTLIDGTYVAKSEIIVVFPYPYKINIYNPDAVLCSATYESTTPSEFVTSGTSCSVYDEIVVFTIPASTTLTSSYWTTFTISEVVEPLYGKERTDGYWDCEDEDLFEVYDYWTGKFCILGITSDATSATAYNSISYDNLNAAYTGYYNSDLIRLVVNKGDDLIVTQGTYSTEYTINTKDGYIMAYSIELQASDENDGVLAFSDDGDYFLTWDFPETTFRVGVPTGTADGFYYISWDIIEDSFTDGVNLYGKPPKTKVQSFMSNQIKISISTISNAAPGFGTFPIEISLNDYTPFSGITIEFKLTTAGAENITFVPSSVEFTDIDSVNYFYIDVSADATTGQTYDFRIDAASFVIESTGSFYVDYITSEEPSITVALDIQSQTDADLNVEVGTDSVVYWALVSTSLSTYDENCTSYDAIVAYAEPLVDEPTDDQMSIDDQFAAWQDLKDAIVAGDDWIAYTYNIIVLSNSLAFYGMNLVPQGSWTVQSFDNLIAGSSITAVAYADNFSGNDLASSNDTQTTDPLSSPCTIELDFDETLSSDLNKKIIKAEAQTIGVPESRIIELKAMTRRLGSVSSNMLLPSATSSEDTVSAASNMDKDVLTTNLAAQGITATFKVVPPTAITADSYPDPSFEGEFYDDPSVVYFNFTIGMDGSISCVVEYNPDPSSSLTSYDVYYGLDRKGGDAYDTKADDFSSGDQEDSWNWNFTETNPDYGNYVFTCTACNNYPILPTCVTDDKLVTYNFTWTNVTDSSSGMKLLVSALSVLLVYLA